MHVLIAPNAFKNSLSADLAAKAINKGLRLSRLECTTTTFPIGDGGDGTGALLMYYLKAQKINATVHDPLGRRIKTSIKVTPGGDVAIIEMADASGLRLLKSREYDPLHATSFGTGELVDHAIQSGAQKILVCVGGTATVDGGMGIIRALGGKFFNAKKKKIKDGPVFLDGLADIDLSGIDKKIYDAELTLLCDVENPLLGEHGAAAVFGPQKGASKKDVKKLDRALTQLRDVVFEKTGKDMNPVKYGGAAGGVAATLRVLLNAKLVSGIEYFLDITGFNKELGRADLLITGEGSIDAQTLHGKAPFGVARRAKERSVPVIGLAGSVPLSPSKHLHDYFDVLLPISHETMDLKKAMKETYDNLVRTAKSVGDLLHLQKAGVKNY